jgi:hypothetical protein
MGRVTKVFISYKTGDDDGLTFSANTIRRFLDGQGKPRGEIDSTLWAGYQSQGRRVLHVSTTRSPTSAGRADFEQLTSLRSCSQRRSL